MKKETTIEFDNQKAVSFLSNTLCRYRAINDKSIDALRNDKLFFSTPGESFNDPFDNLIYADPRKILYDIYKEIQLNMEDYIEQQKRANLKRAAFADLMYHGSHKDRILDEFIEECELHIEQFKFDLLNNTRIICFSELYDSMLMWSHYADQHKGFALIFDKESIESATAYTNEDKLITKKPLLMPVNYVEKQVNLTEDIENHLKNYFMQKQRGISPFEENLSQHKLRRTITEKSLDWGYEKEWRLIPRHIDLDHKSNLGYLNIIPKAVIIGALCTEEDSINIFDICYEKRIPLFDIRVKEWEPGFKLHVSSYKHQ